MITILNSLNSRIREVRGSLKKSQREFAAIVGVSQPRQSRYEQDGTDVPVSYLDKVCEEFGEYFDKHWFYTGEGSIKNTQVNEDPGADYFTNMRREDLSSLEDELLAEVEQFSDFLKKKPLKPQVKRILLERLIESIDQAIEQPRNEGKPSDED